jgi:hypothetical protein
MKQSFSPLFECLEKYDYGAFVREIMRFHKFSRQELVTQETLRVETTVSIETQEISQLENKCRASICEFLVC